MCGISGIVHPDQEAVRFALCAMNSAQAHRGPDDDGKEIFRFSNSWLGLGHRRLAIIDLSGSGHQPMTNGGSGCFITFNGEIFNYLELRAELISLGHTFKTRTDTEVILNAYKQWNTDCLGRFRGMFAFAIWDPSRNLLFLARDHLGVKPLYYRLKGSTIIFASEVRAVISTGLVEKKLDFGGLNSFLCYGSVQEPHTLITGVKSLPAAHFMTFTPESQAIHQYWKMPGPESVISQAPLNLFEEMADRLKHAVELQMLSDAPIGSFLSGGIDSTSIVALMKKSEIASVKTFSIIFDDPIYDERKFARSAAGFIGSEHYELELTEQMVQSEIPGAILAFDQPSHDGLNTYFVSKLVKEAGLTVALSGVGGDELYGGYEGYRHALNALGYISAIRALPPQVREYLWEFLWNLNISSEFLNRGIDLLTSDLHPYLFLRRLFSQKKQNQLLNNNAPYSEKWMKESFDSIVEDCAGHDKINTVSRFELQTYMRSTLLRDTDQMSMAHSLEVRVPLIDHELVDYCLRLTGNVKIEKGTPKPLLTRSLSGLLPAECVNRPKRGFELPLKSWLLKSIGKEICSIFCSGNEYDTFPFDAWTLESLWSDFVSGRTSWTRVWAIYVMLNWIKNNKVSV